MEKLSLKNIPEYRVDKRLADVRLREGDKNITSTYWVELDDDDIASVKESMFDPDDPEGSGEYQALDMLPYTLNTVDQVGSRADIRVNFLVAAHLIAEADVSQYPNFPRIIGHDKNGRQCTNSRLTLYMHENSLGDNYPPEEGFPLSLEEGIVPSSTLYFLLDTDRDPSDDMVEAVDTVIGIANNFLKNAKQPLISHLGDFIQNKNDI